MRCFVYFVLVLVLNPLTHSQMRRRDGSRWAAHLKEYGWSAPKSESNEAFFKDFTLSKLQAVDLRTRVAFTSEAQAVVFHTQQVGQDWQTASRQLQAFFINTSDGSLVTKKEWPTSIRRSENDGIDSESRLIPLNQGVIAIVANRAIMLYDQRLQMVKERKLEPLAADGLWSVQSVANGQEIFVRHQSSADQQTNYSWLASASLSEVSTMTGPQGKQFSVPVTPGENFVLTSYDFLRPGVTTGIIKLSSDGSAKTICSTQLCREDHLMAYSFPFLVVSGRGGITVADVDHGPRWSKSVPTVVDETIFQFGDIRTSMSGKTFALWITASHTEKFDAVQVGTSPKVFVYDTATGRLLATFVIKPRSSDFDFALSPSGGQLVVFDGADIRLYALPTAHSS